MALSVVRSLRTHAATATLGVCAFSAKQGRITVGLPEIQRGGRAQSTQRRGLMSKRVPGYTVRSAASTAVTLHRAGPV